MKNQVLAIAVILAVASCEVPPIVVDRSEADSLQRLIDTLLLDRRDQQASINQAYDSIQAWRNVVTLNHTKIERLNFSLQDLTYELEAARAHAGEMQVKQLSRLDSAVKIIRRQNEQLKYCKCEPKRP